ETYGGVIGNLTLTKYNQKMGNKSYGEKRKVYLDSNIKITRDLGMAYDKWDRESIINRTNELTKELIALFPKPVVKDSRKEELTGEFSITNSLDMTGKNPIRITIGDEDFSVDTWKKMLLTFMEELWQSDSRNYEKIKGDSSLNKMLFESLRRPERLRNGISIETNFSANMILAIIAKVSEICDIADEVSYTVR
ncbi:HNH endonuclease family protein, partial [Limosilactobacillus fermentum]